MFSSLKGFLKKHPPVQPRTLVFIVAVLLLVGCEPSRPADAAQTPTPSDVAAPPAAEGTAETGGATDLPNDALALIDAAGLDFEEKRVIDVYERVAPSVVNITTQVLTRGFFFDAVPQEGAGSGFVLDEAGHVLTNYHVIEGAQQIEITFSDDTVLQAEVAGADPRNDIAVLELTESAPDGLLVPAALGTSSTLQVGQRAVAIGNPFGEFGRTLTTGVVSALDRTLTSPDGVEMSGIIQTDASINRGNSGGPLLDSAGRVVGINSAIFSPSGTSAGVGFAIPVDTVKRVLPDLLELGYYRHPWLGVGAGSAYVLFPNLAEALDLPTDQGLLLVQVDGPLARVGVRGAQRQVILGNRRVYTGGDILTQVDAQPVTSYSDLQNHLERYQVGDEVKVTVLQGGQERTLELTLAEEP